MDGDGRSDKIRLQTWKLIHFKFFEGFVTYFDSPYEWTCPFKWSNILTSWIDQDSVIKMFDHLKGQVHMHMANQNGLQSLQKIWNQLFLMFVIYSCQKIECKCIFYNDI